MSYSSQTCDYCGTSLKGKTGRIAGRAFEDWICEDCWYGTWKPVLEQKEKKRQANTKYRAKKRLEKAGHIDTELEMAIQAWEKRL